MKRTISIFLSVLLLFSLTACKAKTETRYLQTSVTQEYIGNVTFRTETEYDSEGVQTAMIQYTNDEEISRSEYSYTDNSVIARVTQNGEIGTMKQVYEKDEAGNITRTEMYIDDELYSITERTYDENGNCLTNVQETVSLGMTFTISYSYDENGNQISIAYDYGDGVGTYTANIYDSENKLISSQIHDLSGKLTSTEKHSWNADGEESVEVFDAEGNCTSKTRIAYDEHGNIVSSVSFDALGNITSKITYTYGKFEVPVK